MNNWKTSKFIWNSHFVKRRINNGNDNNSSTNNNVNDRNDVVGNFNIENKILFLFFAIRLRKKKLLISE